MAEAVGEDLQQTWGKVDVIQDEYGHWLYATDEEITVCEIFPGTDTLDLTIIKKGHGFVRLNELYYYFQSDRLKQ